MADPCGRAEDRSAANGPTLTGLVSDIVHDAQTLMRQELQLAKVEIKQELTKTRDAALSFAAGAALALWGVILLGLALVFLISWATGLPYWGSFAIVGGLCVVVGAVLLLMGKNRAEQINLLPPQTVQTLEENVQWIKNRR